MADDSTSTVEGDEFELYDLRVEVVESERPFVMHAKKGDYFDVIGGRVPSCPIRLLVHEHRCAGL